MHTPQDTQHNVEILKGNSYRKRLHNPQPTEKTKNAIKNERYRSKITRNCPRRKRQTWDEDIHNIFVQKYFWSGMTPKS